MDIQQLRSWIFELYDPLDNRRQYIIFDADRGNLLVDAPPFSERALRLIRGAGRASLLLVTNAAGAADANRYREALGLQVAAHEADARAIDGGADVTLRSDELLRPDAKVLRVGDITVMLSRKAGGVLMSGDLDLASAAARDLLSLEFSAVLSATRPPIWSAGRDEVLRLQRELPQPRRRFGLLLQAPWDRSYRGRLQDQMKPNPIVPTDTTAAREAAMGPDTLVVARAARDLIEKPARPAWQSAAAAVPAAPAPARASRGRPRNFEENWVAPASPAPPTTIANPARDIQPPAGAHRPAPLGPRFRELALESLAGMPFVDTAGGIDLTADGSEVAFAWTRGQGIEICTAPLEGDRIFQLTGAGARSISPRWSADGRWIAFLRDLGDERYGLWVVDRDGRSERELAPDPGSAKRGPSWSPDGASIAYASSSNGRGGIWVADLGTGRARALTDGAFTDAEPSWSPGGGSIVFTRHEGSRRDLHLVPAAGGASTKLDIGPDEADKPRWSPDGARIGFTSHAGRRSRIALATLRDGRVTSVEHPSGSPYNEWGVEWRPDLRGIVYLNDRDASVSIYRMFIASRATTPVADRPGVHLSPRVGPDGETMAFVYQSGTEPADVWVRRARTVEPHRVTRSMPADLDPGLLVVPVAATYPGPSGPSTGRLFVPHVEAVKRQGRPPAVIHGWRTPHDLFDPLAQILANRGYVVLVPASADAAELIAAAAWLDQTGIADGARIGLVGGRPAVDAVRREPKRFAAMVTSEAEAGGDVPILSTRPSDGRFPVRRDELVEGTRRATEWFERHLQK